jgi:hypothetical protein
MFSTSEPMGKMVTGVMIEKEVLLLANLMSVVVVERFL